jgi:diaminopimelate decarboxylase
MEFANNQFTIGGVNALQLAQEFGTPLYVYNGHKIESQYDRMVNAFKALDCRIKYACKANANINILRLLLRKGASLDVVSIEEAQLGLRAGFAPADILYTPNCVSFDEIKHAVQLGVKINIDNIAILEQFGHTYGGSVPVCVRINPHILAGGHGNIQTGHIDSKFGISIHQLRHILRVVRAYKMRVTGLHMHTGSDILDADVFLAAGEVLFNAALEFEDLESLDFGSGFKVAYKEDDITTDIEALGARLADRMEAFTKEYGRKLQVWFEPGKFLVSESGYLIVQANVIKQTVSTVFVGVNSGLNHLIRPMLYNAYHKVVNLSNPAGVERVYSVVGYICETDTFAWDRKLHEVRAGDVLALCNAGAYGFSMSSNYNCRLRPAEVLVHGGKAHLIRKRETFDDLLANQIELPQLSHEKVTQ